MVNNQAASISKHSEANMEPLAVHILADDIRITHKLAHIN